MKKRFLLKVRKTKWCWIWLASKNVQGYGTFSVNGTPKLAHRVSWSIHKGPIPSGMCVLHKCDNARCVRPSHLFLGTLVDNNADMAAKGRQARGTAVGKLLPSEVRRILKDSRRYAEIAKDFNIDPSNVSHIKRRKTWAYL